MDYYKEQMKLHNLYSKLENETESLSSNSIESWYEEYVRWMKRNKPQYVHFSNSSKYFFHVLCTFVKNCISDHSKVSLRGV